MQSFVHSFIFMIKPADEIASVLEGVVETLGPVPIGVYVDYGDNHKFFEQVNW